MQVINVSPLDVYSNDENHRHNDGNNLFTNSKTIKVRSWIVETAVPISSFEIYKHGTQNMHMIFFRS